MARHVIIESCGRTAPQLCGQINETMFCIPIRNQDPWDPAALAASLAADALVCVERAYYPAWGELFPARSTVAEQTLNLGSWQLSFQIICLVASVALVLWQCWLQFSPAQFAAGNIGIAALQTSETSKSVAYASGAQPACTGAYCMVLADSWMCPWHVLAWHSTTQFCDLTCCVVCCCS